MEGYEKDGRIATTVREDLLRDNPFDKTDKRDKIREPESKREFLAIDEVKRMMKTPFPNKRLKDIKNVYLFSCFCGLRISDIRALTWENVICDNGQYRLDVVMQKTKEPIYLPLSQEALRWLPERGEKIHVFDLPSPTYINLILKPLAKAAGIDKHFTFHTARHTFATMMAMLFLLSFIFVLLIGYTYCVDWFRLPLSASSWQPRVMILVVEIGQRFGMPAPVGACFRIRPSGQWPPGRIEQGRQQKIAERYTQREQMRHRRNGHTIPDILAATGTKSKTTVFSVLNRHGVPLDRGKYSVMTGRREPKGRK